MDYSNLLTPEIEAEMPANLSMADQFRWRQNKANELAANKKRSEAGGDANVSQTTNQTTVNDNDDVQNIINNTDVAETSVDDESFDVSDEKSDLKTSISEATTSDANDVAPIRKKKRIAPKMRQSDDNDGDTDTDNTVVAGEIVKNVPRSVMAAMRRLFPESATKADLISAFVYVHTNGDCEISDRAMQLVNFYSADNELININERLANLERMNRNMITQLQSIELCTCYNTFDRRYGSKERRGTPKDTEFREQGNLDMLARLRQQAVDQKQIDNATKGRQIYEQIKDKGDNR